MPSIQGGGGAQFQNLRPIQGPQAPQVQKAAETQQAPKDTVRVSQTPTGTTQNVQRQQLLTSETTQVRIHQLLQNGQPNQAERPAGLSFLQRSSMASALAETLAGKHVPDPPQSQNTQAQNAAGQQAAVTYYRQTGANEAQDTAWQRSAQSGRKLKKDDHEEGEFSMFDDSAGQGMSQQQSGDDKHSGQQKRRLLVDEKRRQDQEKAEHAAFGDKKVKLPPVPPRNPLEAPKSLTGKTAELKKPELKKIEAPKAEIKKAEIKKPEIKKVEIKRINTMQPPSPPKKAKADEWDF